VTLRQRTVRPATFHWNDYLHLHHTEVGTVRNNVLANAGSGRWVKNLRANFNPFSAKACAWT